MIYSLRHQSRSVKSIEHLRGEKYAVIAFNEKLLQNRSPFYNVSHNAMIDVVIQNSVLDLNRGVRWIKLAVRRTISEYEPAYVVGHFGQSVLYLANFAALFCGGKFVSTYKNREHNLPVIPDEVHRLKALHYFPSSGELEVL